MVMVMRLNKHYYVCEDFSLIFIILQTSFIRRLQSHETLISLSLCQNCKTKVDMDLINIANNALTTLNEDQRSVITKVSAPLIEVLTQTNIKIAPQKRLTKMNMAAAGIVLIDAVPKLTDAIIAHNSASNTDRSSDAAELRRAVAKAWQKGLYVGSLSTFIKGVATMESHELSPTMCTIVGEVGNVLAVLEKVFTIPFNRSLLIATVASLTSLMSLSDEDMRVLSSLDVAHFAAIAKSAI